PRGAKPRKSLAVREHLRGDARSLLLDREDKLRIERQHEAHAVGLSTGAHLHVAARRCALRRHHLGPFISSSVSRAVSRMRLFFDAHALFRISTVFCMRISAIASI